MLRKLASDPRYVALLKQSGPQAQQAGFQLAQNGIARLDHATLEQRLEILSQVSEKVDVPQCAVLARGGNPNDAQALSAAMLSGLEKLPQAQIDRWFDASLKATDAELNKTPAADGGAGADPGGDEHPGQIAACRSAATSDAGVAADHQGQRRGCLLDGAHPVPPGAGHPGAGARPAGLGVRAAVSAP